MVRGYGILVTLPNIRDAGLDSDEISTETGLMVYGCSTTDEWRTDAVVCDIRRKVQRRPGTAGDTPDCS